MSTRNNLIFELRFYHAYGAGKTQQHDNTNYTLKTPSRKSAYAYKLIIDIKECKLKKVHNIRVLTYKSEQTVIDYRRRMYLLAQKKHKGPQPEQIYVFDSCNT